MYTDEYEISLARELVVCKNTIRKIKKSLENLERKYNKSTKFFLNEFQSGTLAGHPDSDQDYKLWFAFHESLKKWEELEKQYLEVIRMTKI